MLSSLVDSRSALATDAARWTHRQRKLTSSIRLHADAADESAGDDQQAVLDFSAAAPPAAAAPVRKSPPRRSSGRRSNHGRNRRRPCDRSTTCSPDRPGACTRRNRRPRRRPTAARVSSLSPSLADARQDHQIEPRAVAHDALRIRRIGLRLRTAQRQIVAAERAPFLGPVRKTRRSPGCGGADVGSSCARAGEIDRRQGQCGLQHCAARHNRAVRLTVHPFRSLPV